MGSAACRPATDDEVEALSLEARATVAWLGLVMVPLDCLVAVFRAEGAVEEREEDEEVPSVVSLSSDAREADQ